MYTYSCALTCMYMYMYIDTQIFLYTYIHLHVNVFFLHMIIIKSFFSLFRYVTFNSCSPELALTAVRILCLASHSVTVAKDILNSITSSQVIKYLFY